MSHWRRRVREIVGVASATRGLTTPSAVAENPRSHPCGCRDSFHAHSGLARMCWSVPRFHGNGRSPHALQHPIHHPQPADRYDCHRGHPGFDDALVSAVGTPIPIAGSPLSLAARGYDGRRCRRQYPTPALRRKASRQVARSHGCRQYVASLVQPRGSSPPFGGGGRRLHPAGVPRFRPCQRESYRARCPRFDAMSRGDRGIHGARALSLLVVGNRGPDH